MSERIAKINKLIKKQLGEILIRELSIKPGVFITISKVDTTADLRYTRVSISIFPEKESDYIIKTIKKEIYSLQGALNKKLTLKPLPRLEFIADATEAQADDIEKILINI